MTKSIRRPSSPVPPPTSPQRWAGCGFATGLTFIHDGTTTQVPQLSSPVLAPLVIAWAHSSPGPGYSNLLGGGYPTLGVWRRCTSRALGKAPLCVVFALVTTAGRMPGGDR